MPHPLARGLDKICSGDFIFSSGGGEGELAPIDNTLMKFYKSRHMHPFICHNKQSFLILILQKKRPEAQRNEVMGPWSPSNAETRTQVSFLCLFLFPLQEQSLNFKTLKTNPFQHRRLNSRRHVRSWGQVHCCFLTQLGSTAPKRASPASFPHIPVSFAEL